MKAAKILLAAVVGVSSVALTGCMTDVPQTQSEAEALRSEGQVALQRMYERDPELRSLVQGAHGYAIFPSIGKAGVIVGGSSGRGVVYKQGRLVGYATLNSLSAGAQVGGQEMSELILFETPEALRRFQDQQTAFTLNASAVAVKAGASNEVVFNDGIAVFTLPTGGFMAEASVAGQQFKYESLGSAQAQMGDTRSDRSISAEVERDADQAGYRMESETNMNRNGREMQHETEVEQDGRRMERQVEIEQDGLRQETEIRTETTEQSR